MPTSVFNFAIMEILVKIKSGHVTLEFKVTHQFPTPFGKKWAYVFWWLYLQCSQLSHCSCSSCQPMLTSLWFSYHTGSPITVFGHMLFHLPKYSSQYYRSLLYFLLYRLYSKFNFLAMPSIWPCKNLNLAYFWYYFSLVPLTTKTILKREVVSAKW